MDKLLNDTEAALMLGITKELLYAYVRNAPKTNLGHTRKLVSKVVDGKNFFTEKELLEFDAYLKEPWSNPGEKRPPIPTYIDEYLKTEIGGKCPVTGKGYPLENAHIIDYAQSLNHHHHNLIRVAKDEHTKADNKVIDKQLLRDTKDLLIARLRNQLRNTKAKIPLPNEIFLGREDTLNELAAAISSNRFIVIEGLGGIGKTELLLNALKNRTSDLPVLWIDIETISSVSDLNIVLNSQAAQLMGEQSGNSLIESLYEKNVILIFDSLEKILISQREETETFIQTLLTQTTKLKVIVTSQMDLSLIDYPKKVIQIEGLNMASSIQLLDVLMVDQPGILGEEKNWLLEFCNGHPLSLKLVASLLIFYKSEVEVKVRVTKTGSLRRPLLNKHNKSNALDVCLSTIYDILTDDQRNALQYLQFFPGGIYLESFPSHTGMQDFSTATAVLMQFFFVELKRERVFVVNPIRPFLKSKMLEKSEFIRLQMIAISKIARDVFLVNKHYIQGNEEDGLSSGFSWIDIELPNLLEAVRIAMRAVEKSDLDQGQGLRKKYFAVVLGISAVLGRYCFARGYFEYGILLNIAGAKVNSELGNIPETAENYMAIVAFQRRQFDLDGLAKTVASLKELAERTNDYSARLSADEAMAELELQKENFKSALDLYKETLHLLSNGDNNILPKIRERHIHHVKGQIAVVYWRMGDAMSAIEQYENILPFIEESFAEENKLVHFNYYGACLCKVGRMQEGLAYVFKTIEGFKNFGQPDYIGNAIRVLGFYIDEYSELATHPCLDELAFELALKGLRHSIFEYIKRLSPTHGKTWVVNNLPDFYSLKLINIMKVNYLSPYDRILLKWGEELMKELDYERFELDTFSLTLGLCCILGEVKEEKESAKNDPTIIQSILKCCSFLNGKEGSRSSKRLFQWLALWMRQVGFDPDATAEELWDKAKHYLE